MKQPNMEMFFKAHAEMVGSIHIENKAYTDVNYTTGLRYTCVFNGYNE